MAGRSALELEAPGIRKLVDQQALALRQDAELRAVQGANALQAKNFDQPAGGVTGNTLYLITEAQIQSSQKWPLLILTFETASGSGRFRIDGGTPTPTQGTQIPSGGGFTLTIPGIEQIRNFRMIAEGGQTLLFSRYLFI